MRSIALFACVSGLATAAAAQVSFHGIGHLNTNGYSFATAVSPDGSLAAGYAENPARDTESVRWSLSGGLVGLGMPGGGVRFSTAQAVTNDGVYVGYNQSLSQGRYFAYRWTQAGGFQDLGDLPGGNSNNLSMAASDNGSVIAGYGNYASSVPQGFVWTQANGIRGVGDLPGGTFGSQANGVSGDGRVVVGGSSAGVDWQAFRWTESGGILGLGTLTGGTYSNAYDASHDGSVIVGAATVAGGVEAMRWTASAGMIGLGDLPGGTHDSTAYGVSADGSVLVGRANTGIGFGGYEAFIWDAEHGMRDLRTVLESAGVDLTGWVLENANSISADGRVIAGDGTNPAGGIEGWVAVIPAPGSGAVLIGALISIPRRARRLHSTPATHSEQG